MIDLDDLRLLHDQLSPAHVYVGKFTLTQLPERCSRKSYYRLDGLVCPWPGENKSLILVTDTLNYAENNV
jgi:hypothetical protein